MKYNIFLFFFIMIFGCTDPSENAPANLKKGDEFFAKKEYEIAEYYYDKIPEESYVYKNARKKIIEIEKVKKLWGQPQATKQEVQEIVLLSHSFSRDNLAQFPIHQFTLVNNTNRKLKMVEIEFVYFDKRGVEVKRLTAPIIAPIEGKKQKQFLGFRPGLVIEEIGKVSAHVSEAHFE